VDYMSTDFGADSSSRFAFRAQTNIQTDRQTRLNALPHAGGYTAGVGNKLTTSCRPGPDSSSRLYTASWSALLHGMTADDSARRTPI